MSSSFLLSLLLVVFILLSTVSSISADDRVKVSFYVMSKCPDATICESLFGPVVQKLSSIIDLHVDYIERGAFSLQNQSCLHGPTECVGNMQQLCVQDLSSTYAPHKHSVSMTTSARAAADQTLWWNFAQCQTADRLNIPDNSATCASSVGLSQSTIDDCVSTKGPQLLYDSAIRTQKAGQSVSCTMTINDKFWCQHDSTWKNCPEGITAAAFQNAICGRYTGPTPPLVCQQQ